MVEEDIAMKLNQFAYPLSARFIAKETNETKKNINSVLHVMLTKKEVEKLTMDPPLWRLTAAGVDVVIAAAHAQPAIQVPPVEQVNQNPVPQGQPPEAQDNIEDNPSDNDEET